MHRRQFISVPLAAGAAAVSTGVALSGLPFAARAATVAADDYVTFFQFNDNWFSSLQDTALRIDAQAAGGTVSANQFYATPGRSAMEIGGGNVVITGNTISGGNQGLYLRGSSRNVVFTGNAITYMQGSAINFYENPSQVTIAGNNLIGKVGGISSGGTTLNVANNLTAAA